MEQLQVFQINILA